MAGKLYSGLWLSRVPLSGCYRYGDVFQLLPAPPPANDPNVIMRHYPLMLELQYDPRIWTEREDDLWCSDAWERERDHHLEKVQGTPGQKDAYEQISGQHRGSAIRRELRVLLTLLTNHTFIDYSDYGESHYWFIPPPARASRRSLSALWRRRVLRRTDTSPVPVWGQVFYPMPKPIDATDSFSTISGALVQKIAWATYYKMTRDEVRAGERPEIEFPDILDDLFEIYFSLEPDKKIAFYAASLLWVQANRLRSEAPSLSLLAAVSAIETLIHYDDPNPERCPQCHTFISSEQCPRCCAPTYGMTKRFKQFIEDHGESQEFAERMYDARSSVAHRGALLRADLFDSGFHTGGKDEQMFFSMDASRITRMVIIKWLAAQGLGASSART